MMSWLEATKLAAWVRESPSIWAYPTILTLHTVGLGIVVGASAVVDLRLLGFATGIRIAALRPLFRILAYGFALNATTGILLFIADATTKSHQTVFYVKLTLIFLALLCTFATLRAVRTDGSRGSVAPSTARTRDTALAAVSLLLWAGAITAGRLMAYL
jgi:hypothetical protein